jgi:hypothetical protein
MYTPDAAATPDAVQEPWNLPVKEPCSSTRVTKSKKKHTKVIEVKGVPMDRLLNGKYRQQGRTIGGRPTFKGGQDGVRAFWYDVSCGKWRGGHKEDIGTGVCDMEATDTAAAPNTVKASWHVDTDFMPSLYPNVVVPTVKAAEQEVPRLVQLKMCALVVAQHMRCLGCGHDYTALAEVVFQMKCMHHHCVCCGEEHGGDVCAVCAEEGGK